jgi:hypothetical protein
MPTAKGSCLKAASSPSLATGAGSDIIAVLGEFFIIIIFVFVGGGGAGMRFINRKGRLSKGSRGFLETEYIFGIHLSINGVYRIMQEERWKCRSFHEK